MLEEIIYNNIIHREVIYKFDTLHIIDENSLDNALDNKTFMYMYLYLKCTNNRTTIT